MINLIWIPNDYFFFRMKTESETKQIKILSTFVCLLFTRLLLYIWFMRKLNNKGKKDCQLRERDLFLCHFTVHFIVTFLHYSALQVLTGSPFSENHIQKKITWNLYAEKFSEHLESATTCCYCFVTFSCSFSRRHKTRKRKKSSIHHRNKEKKKRQRIVALNIRSLTIQDRPSQCYHFISLILFFLILFYFIKHWLQLTDVCMHFTPMKNCVH